MPLSSAARAGEAEAARGWVTHTGQPGRTPRRGCWGRLPGSERRASWRTEPTHSALAWGRVPSSLGALHSLASWPGSWRQGEAWPWGTQAQSDVSGRSAHVPGTQRRVHGPLGHPHPGIELLSCWAAGSPCTRGCPSLCLCHPSVCPFVRPEPLQLLRLHSQAGAPKPASVERPPGLWPRGTAGALPGAVRQARSRPHG